MRSTITADAYRVMEPVLSPFFFAFPEDFCHRMPRDDLQHMLYNAGVASDAVANVILEFVECGRWGPVPPPLHDGSVPRAAQQLWNDRLIAAWREFLRWCRGLGSRKVMPFNVRRLGVCHARHLVSLSDTYKHGDCKVILHWVRHLVGAEDVRPRTLHQELRFRFITNLDDFIVEVEAFGAILTPTEVIEAKSYGWGFLKAAQELYENTGGRYRWGLRPKIHSIHEVLQTLDRCPLNPFWQQCWMEEDFMGKIAKVTSRTHGATSCFSSTRRYLLKLLQNVQNLAR